MSRNNIITAIIGILGFLGVAYFMQSSTHKEFVKLKTDTDLAHVYFVNDPNELHLFGTIILHRGEADMQGPEGLAHYIEHLVSWNALPSRDSTSQRDFNAYTEITNTNYYMNSENYDEVMKYLSGIFSPIKLDEKFMKEEVGIVKREFELNYSENKYAPLTDKMTADAYAGTGMARSVIGDPDDIVNFDPKTAINAFETHYFLQNADLVLRGDMTPREATKLVNQYFSKIKKANPAPRALDLQKFEPRGRDIQTLTVENIPTPWAYSGWILPYTKPMSQKENAIQNMVSAVLTSQQKHMFARKLIDEDKNFSSINASFVHLPNSFGNGFGVSGEIRNEKKPDYLAVELKNWVASIENSPEYLLPAMEGYLKQTRKAGEKLKPEDDYNDLIQNLSMDILPMGGFSSYLKALEKVTPQDVIDELKKIIAQENDISRIYIN